MVVAGNQRLTGRLLAEKAGCHGGAERGRVELQMQAQ